MNLSQHFTLEELTHSEVAARKGLDNTPNLEVTENLKRTAAVMERVRELLMSPVVVHSGYRSQQVNKAVGGTGSSAHCKGLACDFTVPGFGKPYDVAFAIAPNVEEFGIDQLILEYGWVHIGLSEGAPRHQLLTKRSAVAPYEVGINP